jgi:ribosomal protein S18 acetylase RimI-like enzyme
MTPPTSIRLATVADAAPLAALAAELFPSGCPETAPEDLAAYISTELTAARMASQIADPNHIVLLALAGVRLVGFILVARQSPPEQLELAEAAEIRKLYLSPQQHGSGVASVLMESALALLASAAPRPIWLSTHAGNARAVAFYRKWGFEIVGEKTFLVGNDPQRDYLLLRK